MGRRIRAADVKPTPWAVVIGYVQDVKHYGLERPMRPGLYHPLGESTPSSMAVALKTDGAPEALATSARAAIRELDPELPLFNVRSMQEAMRRTMTVRLAYSWMLAVFALTALMLALGGTYGVSSYLVGQRAREFGIRVALGAGRTDIIRGVLRTTFTVAAAGIAVGIVASLGASRLLDSLLFGVSPRDAMIFASSIGVLIVTAIAANVLPARRAARVDPMISLRAE